METDIQTAQDSRRPLQRLVRRCDLPWNGANGRRCPEKAVMTDVRSGIKFCATHADQATRATLAKRANWNLVPIPNVRGQAGRAKRVQHATERRTRPCLHRAC